MNILITNDDGIFSDGIIYLKAALEKLGKVYVAAPERPRSACGHSITLHKPLRASLVTIADGSKGFSVSGTPTDCVCMGLLELFKDVEMDMVVSGINSGPNLGWDLTYSGTFAAAMEGTILGKKSMAVSIASHAENLCYEAAANVALRVARMLFEKEIDEYTFLNVS